MDINLNKKQYKELEIRRVSAAVNNMKASAPDNYFYFKNFQILKLGSSRQILGKGAFAEVLLVKSKLDGNKFAMKVIEKKKVDNISIIREEIKIHLMLDNKNIIKLYSYSETNDFFYLIMEYASKGNIFNEIRTKSTFDESITRNYFIQTINGIAYLHSLGFAHRDIKPENLLIDKNNIVKICDFGGAVKIEDGQHRKTFFGTYEYMAPEVIDGSNYDRSVDIWALGILLYELLHGYSPFRIIENKDNMKEYYQIYENIMLNGDVLVNDTISDEATHLIRSKLSLTNNRLINKG